MTSGFAPEFLILLGVDIFLGASILTVLLDRHFPGALPYVLEGASLIGFAELMAGPGFLGSFTTELQFYYSFTYAMIAVLTLFATNLYLLFLRRRPFESAVLGLCGTIPAGLGTLYFTSAFVNGLDLSLPLVPVIPIGGVYAMFGLSIGLVVFSLIVFGRRKGPIVERDAAPRSTVEQPISLRASGSDQEVVVEQVQPAPRQTQERDKAQSQPKPSHEAERTKQGAPKEPRSGSLPGGALSMDSNQLKGTPRDSGVSNSGTVLVEESDGPTYAQRLIDSIRFFEKAVDRPVKIDPNLLGGTLKGAKKAYLTPAGTLMVEDSKGKSTSVSLMDISTDEALQVMKYAMKGLKGGGDRA